MKLDEIAKRIDAHLQRFSEDPEINAPNTRGLTPYYNPSARRAGSWVSVNYVSFQHHTKLTKADAEKYLEWLDAGNVGKHYAVVGW